MKHLLMLLAVLVVVYTVWHLTLPLKREEHLSALGRHGLRLGAMVLAVLALLVLAYYLPAMPLL